ncbi:MAG: sensor histidine kinase [Bacteroidaceae bacterium]|nr:sensor histidine kinase [Bacteroidaceae bacterium]
MKSKKFYIILIGVLLSCASVYAQQAEKSKLQQQAEAAVANGNPVNARSLYIKAFESYATKGQTAQGVKCGVKATALYNRENKYKEAFELLRSIDQSIANNRQLSAKSKAALYYQTSRERFQMYLKMRRSNSAEDQLGAMERHMKRSVDESIQNDYLYNRTIYYYSFGQIENGNASFKEMATRLTASREYDKVDSVYKALIANGRRSNNANLVAQSYGSYIVWKDSVADIKHAEEISALQKQIASHEATIAEKDGSLSSRKTVIISLITLTAILAALLVIGLVVLLRFIILTRRQKKTIKMQKEIIALKAQFIGNISGQMNPTIQKLDSNLPEVKGLKDFISHIQTLSDLETSDNEPLETEETQINPFCQEQADVVRSRILPSVTLAVNAPNMRAKLYIPFVSHIIQHLLIQAALHTPENGHITLEFKKRGPHKHQFLISNTGTQIPEEERENMFKPFIKVHDLTQGDGLGLPICKQMAMKMNGDIHIDPEFTRGTRFILDLVE